MDTKDIVQRTFNIKNELESYIGDKIFDKRFAIDLNLLVKDKEETYLLIEHGNVLPEKIKVAFGKREDYYEIKIKGEKEEYFISKNKKKNRDFYFYIKEACKQYIKTFIENFDQIGNKNSFNDGKILNRAIINYMNAITQGNVELVNDLSLELYEKRPNMGKMIFVKNSGGVNFLCKFKRPISFKEDEKRLIRKLLELTSESCAVIICGSRIIGLGTIEGKSMVLYKNQYWEININNSINLCFEKGSYRIKKANRELEYENELSKINIENRGNLIKLINEFSIGNHHGALWIFSKYANIEAERLGNKDRGIILEEPINFMNKDNIKIISNLSAIDGALLFDFNLNCYGIGYILDGNAIISGMPSRGSRYNSANCYIWNLKAKYFFSKDDNPFGLVFSEDGGVNCLCTEIDEQTLKIDAHNGNYKFMSKDGEEIILKIDGR